MLSPMPPPDQTTSNAQVFSIPEGIAASSAYSVRILDGSKWISVFCHVLESEKGALFERRITWASFVMGSSPVRVEVTRHGAPLTSAVVRPRKHGIDADLGGNTLVFEMAKPANVAVEVDESWSDMICIFANAPDDGPPPGTTRYYGPGVHSAGVVELADNEIVYLDGGAYVKGVFQFPHGTSGQQILGMGIISGVDEVGKGEPWSRMNGTKKRADWSFVESSGQSIRNVTFVRPSDPFLLWLADGALVDNVKFLAHPENGRGRHVGGEGAIALYGKTRPFLLQNCFAVTTDDCYKFEYNDAEGSVIRDSTMATFGGSPLGGIWNAAVGSNTRGVTVENCDVIATTDNSYLLEGLVYAMPPNVFGTHGPVFDLTFRNIVVEADNTPLNRLCGFQATEGGPVHDICFENVVIHKQPRFKSLLKGHDTENPVRDITFSGVSINGVPLSADNAASYIEIHPDTTSSIRFEPVPAASPESPAATP